MGDFVEDFPVIEQLPSWRSEEAANGSAVAGAVDRSDGELVYAVGQGDSDALAEIYRRYGGAVFGLARRLCGTDRAEDVAQEIFVRLWLVPDGFDPDRGPLRGYLLTLTHSRSVDMLRSDIARQAREAAILSDTAMQCNVEGEVLAAYSSERVRKALSDLPKAVRQPIVLAYFGGNTYRSVAGILQQPEGTIKSRIRAGLGQLRAALHDT